MASRAVSRSLLSRSLVPSLLTRSSPPISGPSLSSHSPLSSSLFRLRSLVSAAGNLTAPVLSIGLRHFSTRRTSSSLNDPSPNWSNRPPKETILLDGCDFNHWLVVVDPPEGNPTRDELIDSYIKTLASVVGDEQEARMKIYSVSTRCYFAFGALVDEETSYKLKDLPKVRWVLPDSYLDVRNKDYGGEPFINGEAVPYDPKYHEEWIRNNQKANDRNRRNDRPRSNDRSRNFERRRQNMQNDGSPPQNGGPPMQGGAPQNPGPGMQPNNYRQPMPNSGPNMPQQPNNFNRPGGNMANMHPMNPGPNMHPMNPGPNMPNPGPNMANAGGMAQPNNPGMQQFNNPGMNNAGPAYNMGRQSDMTGGPPPNAGWQGNGPNFQNNGFAPGPNPGQNFQGGAQNGGNMGYQNRDMSGPAPNQEFQNNFTSQGNSPGGNF